MNLNAQEGWWGTITSTIDWCEENYTIIPWIAEFFNTISSLSLVFLGCYGLFIHDRQGLELRFKWLFASVALVGCGSIAFHASLKFHTQLLDELPMYYAVILCIWILAENDPPSKVGLKYGLKLPIGLSIYAIFFSVLLANSYGVVQIRAFQANFIFLQVSEIAYIVYLIFKIPNAPQLKQVAVEGMVLYSLGYVFWNVDFWMCDVVKTLPVNPQFHAFWHVFASMAVYRLSILLVYMRRLALGQKPRFRRFALGLFMWVEAGAKLRRQSTLEQITELVSKIDLKRRPSQIIEEVETSMVQPQLRSRSGRKERAAMSA